MNETFICYVCKREFPMTDDEEARAEFARNWPGHDIRDAQLTCDDCNEAVLLFARVGFGIAS